MSFNLSIVKSMRSEIDIKEKEEALKPTSVPKTIHTFYGDLLSCMRVQHVTNYLDADYADALFDRLKRIKYNSDEESMIMIMGRKMKIPRKQVAYGDPSANYHFSGTNVQARDWNLKDNSLESRVGRELRELSQRVGDSTCCKYNYTLVNNYLDQTKGIGYHADDEKELGKFPIIAGISLGQNRKIYFQSQINGEIVKVPLPHNSLFVMYYPTNKFWKHSIPKQTKRLGQRISLTFRSVGSQ